MGSMEVRMSAVVNDMLVAVYNLNESGLIDKLDAAFDMYPIRLVFSDIITPMMCEIGCMWERGELMVVMEHFASNIIITKLKALLNKRTKNVKGPVVIVGCAPNEMHEIGSLMVAFFMNFNGWEVIYLGQNVPTTDLINIVDTMEVHTIALSATTNECLSSLKTVGAHIASRSKRKKIEFLVGGGLLRMGDGNVLETIPTATSRNAGDLYAYRPPAHPIHQDTIVGGDIYSSCSFIYESFRKMRLERRGHLLGQSTDGSVGTTVDKNDNLLEGFKETSGDVDDPVCSLDRGKSLDSVCVEKLPNIINNDNNKPNNAPATISPSVFDSSIPSPKPLRTSSSSDLRISFKAKLEKQKQQTLALKENLLRYQEGTKAAKTCIARSLTFLYNHWTPDSDVPTEPDLEGPILPYMASVHPPPTVVHPTSAGLNRLIGHRPPITYNTSSLKSFSTLLHAHDHDPLVKQTFTMEPDKESLKEPEFLDVV